MTLNQFSPIEQIQQVKRAFRRGTITQGEYFGKLGEILTFQEKKLFEQNSDKDFNEIPEYTQLLKEIEQ